MELEKEIKKFLKNEFITLSVIGAMGQGKPAYVGKEGKHREPFKKYLRKELSRIGEEYINSDSKIREEKHIQNIENFSNNTKKFGKELLVYGQLNIGRTQKLINLYLKYLWTWGEMTGKNGPPHCPFDEKIITYLEKKTGKELFKPWTGLMDIKEYKKYIDAAKKVAEESGFCSVAEWELATWNNR
ncbi:MAG: hypothetical protein WC745_03080 [Patescibacteria group bacterium]|jgi:hypothetical protein